MEREEYMERETERGVEMRMCVKMKMRVYTSAAKSLHISRSQVS